MWVEALGETPSYNESFIKFGQAAAETRESDKRGHRLLGDEKSLVHSVHFKLKRTKRCGTCVESKIAIRSHSLFELRAPRSRRAA